MHSCRVRKSRTTAAHHSPLARVPMIVEAKPQEQERVTALRASRLAVHLTDQQLETLARSVTMRDVAVGEMLVREGASDDHLYAVVSGLLGVTKSAGTPEQTTLHTLGPGDLVGELSFIDGTVHY